MNLSSTFEAFPKGKEDVFVNLFNLIFIETGAFFTDISTFNPEPTHSSESVTSLCLFKKNVVKAQGHVKHSYRVVLAISSLQPF